MGVFSFYLILFAKEIDCYESVEEMHVPSDGWVDFGLL